MARMELVRLFVEGAPPMNMFIRTFRNLYPVGMFEYFELHEADGAKKGEAALFILKGYLLEHPRKAQPDWLFIAAFRQQSYFDMAFDLVQIALMNELVPTIEKLVEVRSTTPDAIMHRGGSSHSGAGELQRCIDLRPIQQKDSETFAEPDAEEGRQGRVIDIGPISRVELPSVPVPTPPAAPPPAATQRLNPYQQAGRGGMFDAIRGMAEEMQRERREIYGNQQQQLAQRQAAALQPFAGSLGQLIDEQRASRAQLSQIQAALTANPAESVMQMTGVDSRIDHWRDTPAPGPEDVAVIGGPYEPSVADILADVMPLPSPDLVTTPDH